MTVLKDPTTEWCQETGKFKNEFNKRKKSFKNLCKVRKSVVISIIIYNIKINHRYNIFSAEFHDVRTLRTISRQSYTFYIACISL